MGKNEIRHVIGQTGDILVIGTGIVKKSRAMTRDGREKNWRLI